MLAHELLPLLTLDDLRPPLNLYAKAIGIDNLYGLAELIGGKRLYIPKPDLLFQSLKRRLIIADYDNGGYTIGSLALKYEVSPQTVFNYTRK